MPAFGDLSIALSSLFAQQRGMEVTGQNVANANTQGYTRQRVELQANEGPISAAVFARWEGGGEGVNVAGTQRLNDNFLDARAFNEHGTMKYLSGQQDVLGRVEQSFGEPGDNGIQSMLSQFWAGWHDVSNNPGDLAARNQLLQQATTLTQGINQGVQDLSSLWTTTRQQVNATIDEVNTTASTVASLNQRILAATQAGLSANDLEDQRDTLVMQLAESLGVTAKASSNGTTDLFLGGTALVLGSTANALKVAGPSNFSAVPDPSSATGPAIQIEWAKDSYPASVSAGQVGAMVDGLNNVIPAYRQQLNTVAATLINQVNTQHTAGWDLNGTQGGAFFTGTSAADISVAVTDPKLIAASSQPPTTDVNGNVVPNLDGGNAAALGEFGTSQTGADAAYQQLIVNLGVQSQTANRRVDIQQNITQQIDNARQGQSGVNMDEEMSNMLMFQHAYEGAARYLTSVDQMLDVLINHTGIAGIG